MRPIPAPRIGESHGLLRAISTRDRVRLDEFVTEFQNEDLFPPGLENAQGRIRQFVSYARSAGLLKEDRGVVELTEIGKRYIRAGDADAAFEVSEAQADWLRRQLLEKHMTDSIYHGLAIGLSLLSSVPPGTRISMLDFGRALGYLGRAGWDNDNTLQGQGERYLTLMGDMRMIDDQRALTPTGQDTKNELTLPIHMSMLDIAAQLNPGGADAVRTEGEAEWARLEQAAAEPEPEPPSPSRGAAPPRARRRRGGRGGRVAGRRPRRPRARPRLPPRRPRPARDVRPADAARGHLGDRRPRRRHEHVHGRRRRRAEAGRTGRARAARPAGAGAAPAPPAERRAPRRPPRPPSRSGPRTRRPSSPARASRRRRPPPPSRRGSPRSRRPAPRQASGFLDAGAIRAAAEGQGLRLPSAAYASLAAALAAGRHVVLTGPAGSGKTTLALAVARAAVTSGRAGGAVLVTPTAHWSSGEALGRRARDGEPATTGAVPDAATRGKWLVIDELDRARADKALGGLSTFLGGLPLTLPGGEEVKPPEDWRVIATAAAPLDASPVLTRRFAHIAVPFPDQADVSALLEHAAGGDAAAANAAERLLTLRELGPLGAGVFTAAAAYAAERNAIEPADERTLAREAYSRLRGAAAGRPRRPRAGPSQGAAGRAVGMAARGGPEERAALARAKARLDRLDFHPRPVRTARTRIWHAPWLFRLPWFRRFQGYESCEQIFIRRPLAEVSDDLICHELCHVWQEQHGRLRMWLSYVQAGYRENPNEVEARRAVELTR